MDMSVIQTIRKRSGWTYSSSSTASISAGIAAGGGGFIDLEDPKGNDVRLTLAMAGAGASKALLPVYVNIAGSAVPSTGRVYMTGYFDGDELSRSDITGVCYAADAAAAMPAVGISGTVLFCGIAIWRAVADRALWVSFPTIAMFKQEMDLIFDDDDPIYINPKAVIIMGGPNVSSAVAGVGVDGYLGYIW
jgi:hypothetical protein